MNIAFIPIRSGSQGIKNKNVKDFCGQPLCSYVIDECLKSVKINLVVVATDKEYVELLKNRYKNKIYVYLRDPRNSRSESTTESVMIEYINELIRDVNISDDDKLVLAQATNPFTRSNDIDRIVMSLEKNESLRSSLSVVNQSKFEWFVSNDEVKSYNYDYRNRKRRQDDDRRFVVENGALYISYIKDILKNKNRLSGRIGYVLMPEYTQFEIDTEDDWYYAEYLYEKYCK